MFKEPFSGKGKVDPDHEKRVENDPGVTEEQLQQRDALLAAELNEWGVRNRQFVQNMAQCPETVVMSVDCRPSCHLIKTFTNYMCIKTFIQISRLFANSVQKRAYARCPRQRITASTYTFNSRDLINHIFHTLPRPRPSDDFI